MLYVCYTHFYDDSLCQLLSPFLRITTQTANTSSFGSETVFAGMFLCDENSSDLNSWVAMRLVG